MPDMPMEQDSPVPLEQMPRRKHKRGRRSKGKGAQAHQADAAHHVANATAAIKQADHATGLSHLFKAVRSMHAAKAATVPDTDRDEM